MINATMTQQFIGYPIVGALGGLGLGTLNQNFSNNLYGNSSNDPFTGLNWDFVLTGASLGGGVALASAGIKYQAQQMKIQRTSSFVNEGLNGAKISATTAKLLAMSGRG